MMPYSNVAHFPSLNLWGYFNKKKSLLATEIKKLIQTCETDKKKTCEYCHMPRVQQTIPDIILVPSIPIAEAEHNPQAWLLTPAKSGGSASLLV